MPAAKQQQQQKAKKEDEHKACGKIIKDKSTQTRELNEKWLP